jgi:hypothetical protein
MYGSTRNPDLYRFACINEIEISPAGQQGIFFIKSSFTLPQGDNLATQSMQAFQPGLLG